MNVGRNRKECRICGSRDLFEDFIVPVLTDECDKTCALLQNGSPSPAMKDDGEDFWFCSKCYAQFHLFEHYDKKISDGQERLRNLTIPEPYNSFHEIKLLTNALKHFLRLDKKIEAGFETSINNGIDGQITQLYPPQESNEETENNNQILATNYNVDKHDTNVLREIHTLNDVNENFVDLNFGDTDFFDEFFDLQHRSDENFNSFDTMLKNLYRCTSSKECKCKICAAAFQKKVNIRGNKQRDNQIVCVFSRTQFMTHERLVPHLLTRYGHKPYQREYCLKKLSKSFDLMEHKRSHATRVRPFKCNKCFSEFKTSTQLQSHNLRHSRMKHQCDVCCKMFDVLSELNLHRRRRHYNQSYKYGHCRKVFVEKASLTKHIRCHTGEKPFACNICKRKFSDCSNCRKHMKLHKTISIKQQIAKIAPSSPNTNAGNVELQKENKKPQMNKFETRFIITDPKLVIPIAPNIPDPLSTDKDLN